MLEIYQEKSVLAIITEKDGIAAAFAHDHFIGTSRFEGKLEINPSDKTLTKGVFSFDVKSLLVGDEKMENQWLPALMKKDIYTQKFPVLSADDKKTITTNMLSKDQLDAEKFPKIIGKIIKVSDKKIKISFNIHGKDIIKDLTYEASLKKDAFEAEAFGNLTFSECGITPYSALLGAVKNKDLMTIFIHLEGRLTP